MTIDELRRCFEAFSKEISPKPAGDWLFWHTRLRNALSAYADDQPAAADAINHALAMLGNMRLGTDAQNWLGGIDRLINTAESAAADAKKGKSKKPSVPQPAPADLPRPQAKELADGVLVLNSVAAQELHCSESKIHRLVDKGELAGVFDGKRRIGVTRNSVDGFNAS